MMLHSYNYCLLDVTLNVCLFFPQLNASNDYFENSVAMNKMIVQKSFEVLRELLNKDL